MTLRGQFSMARDTYDNFIVGAAYQRDFFQFNRGILVGAEIGLADRFGHYKICCNPISYSERIALR